MNRKSKIIVSVVGIFIVLLALLGITYGYFLTRIEGNTNDTSISITTANLRIVYNDASPNIEATNIQPGDTVYTKTFTVTNEGNEVSDYEVYLENVINDFVNYDDLLMFIACSSNIAGNTCNGYGDGSVSNNIPTFGDSTYSTENSKLIENTIKPASTGVAKEVHTYTLYLKFRDNGDQSDDMGKTLQGKVQIYDPKDIVSISGEITNYTEGDYVELHSEVKTSEIKKEIIDGIMKYTYVFHGVSPEEGGHTITIKNRINNGTINTIGSKLISVNKGTEQSISKDASDITINDNTTSATINITVSDAKNSITLNGISIKETIKNNNPFNETSLAYQIYENKAKIQEYTKNGANYTKGNIKTNMVINEFPETVTDIADGTIISDNGLFSAKDDYGTSYLYRGSVINNYVDFAGFTWRIVRINGNGSVRLILDGTLDKVKQRLADGTTGSQYVGNVALFNRADNDNTYIGYTHGQAGATAGSGEKTAYDLTHEYTGDKNNTNDKSGQSYIKQAIEDFYKKYLLEKYNDYISDTLFCGDKSLANNGIGGVTTQLGYGKQKTFYAASERLSNNPNNVAKPDLKCINNNITLTEEQKSYSRYTVNGNDIKGIKTNDDLIYPIALLSADELVMAGAYVEKSNLQYYLYNEETLSNYWWTMTPQRFSSISAFNFYSYVSNFSIFYSTVSDYIKCGIRPVINLDYKKALYDDGDGTELNPYKVKLAS